MNYCECLEYLEQVQITGIKFGLDNVRTVLSQLSNPHLQYPSLIVGGSNGKGSVCAMVSRILTLSGYNTGLYTSPHLMHVEERIRINDKPISKEDFSHNLTILKDQIEELILKGKLRSHLTYFETLTCLAFLYFQKKDIDLAVLEVGMGGRFDATNVVTPVLSIITTISPEHQEFLGSTVEEIASEKAGIIKSGIPVICGVEDLKALTVILEKAERVQSEVQIVFPEKTSLKVKKSADGYIFTFHTKMKDYHFSPSLQGRHQGKNAATAIVAMEQLSRIWNPIQPEMMIKGIQSTPWEGRLEILSRKPLIIADGAHNQEGALALRTYIMDHLTGPITLVFASKLDKNIEEIANILFPDMKKIILTRFPFRKSAHPEELLKKIPAAFQSRIIIEPVPEKAFSLALKGKRRDPLSGCVLISGSLFLAGEAKKYFSHDHLIRSGNTELN